MCDQCKARLYERLLIFVSCKCKDSKFCKYFTDQLVLVTYTGSIVRNWQNIHTVFIYLSSSFLICFDGQGKVVT